MALTPSEIIAQFGGTQAAAARALGVSRAAVCKWVKTGKVPELRQYQATTRLRAGSPSSRSGHSS